MEKKTIKIIVLILIAALSIIAGLKAVPDSKIYDRQINMLDEKKENVLKITGLTTATSVLITVLPGDIASPVAEKLADVSGYFVIVLCAIFLEKYLLKITAMAAFVFVIPLALVFFGIHAFKDRKWIHTIGLKLLAFGLAMILIIPVSLWISKMIENTYESSLEETISSAESINERIREITGTIEPGSEENDKTDAGDKNSTGIQGIIDSVTGKVTDVTDSVKGVVNAAAGIDVSEILEMVGEEINGFLEAVAVMMVTSCVIPILILILFIWIIKIIFATSADSGTGVDFQHYLQRKE